jgi:hypothetical protein
MNKIRLRAIKFDVDFRKNEWTNYNEFKRSRSFPGDLKANEAFLFVSKSGNQLIWILNIIDSYVVSEGRVNKQIVDSRRWRITSSQTWDPLMLANYAIEVGIELIGIKKFEDHVQGK